MLYSFDELSRKIFIPQLFEGELEDCFTPVKMYLINRYKGETMSQSLSVLQKSSHKPSVAESEDFADPINILQYQWQQLCGDLETMLHSYGYQILEMLHGFRKLEQLSRWMTHDVFHKLRLQISLRERHRDLTKKKQIGLRFRIHRCQLNIVSQDELFCTLLVQYPGRLRALVIGVETFRDRWRICEIHLL